MRGLFLHAAWRSSGTWLWEKLRSQPENMGFYEPLNEELPVITPAKISAMHARSWESRRFGMTRPYFEEYAPLLKDESKGVPGARRAFSFDRFFQEPEEENSELYWYIKRLCDAAHTAGCRPVLKFTRSQGRLAWFARHFPDADHALIIRQPWAMFRSAWRCWEAGENPYFLAMPLLVLERNAKQRQVRALIQALELPVRPAYGPLCLRFRRWMVAAQWMHPATLYRASLALWVLNTSRALPFAGLVLDGDGKSAVMAAPFGLAVNEPRPVARPSTPPGLTFNELRRAHSAALDALPGSAAMLTRWLAPAEAMAERELAAPPWRTARQQLALSPPAL